MSKYFLRACFGIAIIGFIGFLLASKDNYQKHYPFKYDLRNYYPYELNYEMRFKENIFGNCLLLLSTLALLGCFTTFFFTSTNAFTYVVASVGLFGSFIPAAIVFTPLTAGKKHIIIDCIAFFLAFLTPGLIAIESFRLFNHLNNSVALVAFIISILICLVIFILIMNPKITKWAEMEKHVNEDGSATYQRPKYFVLAFSEWIVIFTVYLTIIPFIILSFIG